MLRFCLHRGARLYELTKQLLTKRLELAELTAQRALERGLSYRAFKQTGRAHERPPSAYRSTLRLLQYAYIWPNFFLAASMHFCCSVGGSNSHFCSAA